MKAHFNPHFARGESASDYKHYPTLLTPMNFSKLTDGLEDLVRLAASSLEI